MTVINQDNLYKSAIKNHKKPNNVLKIIIGFLLIYDLLALNLYRNELVCHSKIDTTI